MKEITARISVAHAELFIPKDTYVRGRTDLNAPVHTYIHSYLFDTSVIPCILMICQKGTVPRATRQSSRSTDLSFTQVGVGQYSHAEINRAGGKEVRLSLLQDVRDVVMPHL